MNESIWNVIHFDGFIEDDIIFTESVNEFFFFYKLLLFNTESITKKRCKKNKTEKNRSYEFSLFIWIFVWCFVFTIRHSILWNWIIVKWSVVVAFISLAEYHSYDIWYVENRFLLSNNGRIIYYWKFDAKWTHNWEYNRIEILMSTFPFLGFLNKIQFYFLLISSLYFSVICKKKSSTNTSEIACT